MSTRSAEPSAVAQLVETQSLANCVQSKGLNFTCPRSAWSPSLFGVHKAPNGVGVSAHNHSSTLGRLHLRQSCVWVCWNLSSQPQPHTRETQSPATLCSVRRGLAPLARRSAPTKPDLHAQREGYERFFLRTETSRGPFADSPSTTQLSDCGGPKTNTLCVRRI